MTVVDKRNVAIRELLNGTNASLKSVIPLSHQINKPELLGHSIHIQFGVLIGITGDVKGKLLLSGPLATFSVIGEAMFGMPVEGDMLSSFSGELGNMIAGNLSTIIGEKGINMDITHPTIIQGDTNISGYRQALNMTVKYEHAGEMAICLLID